MNHPVDEHTHNDGVTNAVLLAPVKCVDCGEYVPLGWVEYGTVKCPFNFGSTGVQYGHRVESYIVTHVKDGVYNRLVAESKWVGQ